MTKKSLQGICNGSDGIHKDEKEFQEEGVEIDYLKTDISKNNILFVLTERLLGNLDVEQGEQTLDALNGSLKID